MTEPLVVTSFDRLHFLAIDDDRAILELVDAFLHLASVGGVIKSTSCLAALNILADQQKKIDCIICDHSMPNMTGLELLKQIRAGHHTHVRRDMPFIMLTSHGQEAVVRAAIGLDVNGYIVKPVSKDALVKTIHRTFGRPITLKPAAEYGGMAVPSGDG